MNTRSNLNGRWKGYYTQHDDRRPITALFEHLGDRLLGTMHDGCTDFESSISEVALRQGLAPGTDEQIAARLRSACPEAPDGPIWVESKLPAESVLEGAVTGRSVRFLKTYRGRSFEGYRIGNFRIGAELEAHSVQYHGQLSEDGREIEGRWMIPAVPEQGLATARSEGEFVLQREPATE
jgi:hypothetical protein